MSPPQDVPSVQDVASHYDELSAFYLKIWGEHLHHGLWESGKESAEVAVRNLLHLVAKEAALQGGEAICDVGCGYGGTARFLAQEYGAKVTALTVSPVQYDYARGEARSNGSPTYLLVDWLKNQFSSNAFDVVLAIESTEHMADIGACFREFYRVLRPGGRLVVCAWLAKDAPRAWESSYLLEPICREGRLAGLGTENGYREWMRAAGFRLGGFQDLSLKVRKTWPLCIARGLRLLVQDPTLRRFFFREKSPNKVFTKTMFRMWAGYRTGSLRYGIFTAQKP